MENREQSATEQLQNQRPNRGLQGLSACWREAPNGHRADVAESAEL